MFECINLASSISLSSSYLSPLGIETTQNGTNLTLSCLISPFSISDVFSLGSKSLSLFLGTGACRLNIPSAFPEAEPAGDGKQNFRRQRRIDTRHHTALLTDRRTRVQQILRTVKINLLIAFFSHHSNCAF